MGVTYLPKLALALITLIVGLIVIGSSVKMLKKHLTRKATDVSLIIFLCSLLGIILKALLLISVASMIGIETTSFIAVLGAAGLAIVAPDVATTLFGEEFREQTIVILPFVGVAIFTAAFRRFYLDLALHLGLKTERFIWTSIATLIVSLISNYLLITRFGLLGAAYAAIITAWTEVVLMYAVGRKSFALPFPLGDMFKISVATAIMVVSVMSVSVDIGFAGLVSRIIVGMASYAALILILDVGSVRRHLIQNYFRRAGPSA